jgi:protoporphyrinogen/coproporphyrinogen III oxidase
MRIAIIGGGLAGLTATYELAHIAREGVPVEAVLYESSNRLGGLIDTVREGGFTVECGPDAWVTAKPWAAELATELGLANELIPSNDAARKTWVYINNKLAAMPDGMNLMVPTNLDALEHSPLFTPAAIAAYRAEPTRAAELLATIPPHDESVADFTLRHFGPEVLARVAAPLLSGVFGGDVHTLSARAVLPTLIQMERTHGSLITALQASKLTTDNSQLTTVFTTLRTGLGTLIDRLIATIPTPWLRLNTTVTALTHSPLTTRPWTISTSNAGKHFASELFDAVFLATSLDTTRQLLTPLSPESAQLLPTESSSAVLVAFCFPDATKVPIPPGFGFLVPPSPATNKKIGISTEGGAFAAAAERPPHQAVDSLATEPTSSHPLLLACTFADQKFPHRVPPGGRLLRAFFGGPAAERLAPCNNDEIAAIACLELARILNANAPAPLPTPILTVVRRWPNSLPQYAVGHLERAAELESHLRTLPGLTLLGNPLHGVGLPDLIRAARQAAQTATRPKEKDEAPSPRP